MAGICEGGSTKKWYSFKYLVELVKYQNKRPRGKYGVKDVKAQTFA